jgi:ADP-heptose:LPS heptosyltransferase
VNLCGTQSLDQLIDTINNATLLCANSTGVLHVAAACGIGVVGFFPSTPSMSARRWGPYTDRAIVLESGPGDDMTTITVDAALDAVRTLLMR